MVNFSRFSILGNTILRQSQDGCIPANSGAQRQPQTGSAPDAKNGIVRDLHTTEHEQNKSFETGQQLTREVKQWFHWYNQVQPHQGLKYKTPDLAFCDNLKSVNQI